MKKIVHSLERFLMKGFLTACIPAVFTLAVLALSGCPKEATRVDPKAPEPTAVETTPDPELSEVADEKDPALAQNPLLQPWPGPHGGIPPFDKIEVEHFQPALDWAMKNTLATLDKIAANQDEPTFENTIEPFEKAFRTYRNASSMFGVWSVGLSSSDFQSVEQEMMPKMAAFQDKITQNEPLFRRIEAIYKGRNEANLNPEQKRLAWKLHNDFVRSGAALEPGPKARLSEINQRLATLFTQFRQNVLADEENQILLLEDKKDLAGLPTSLVNAAAAEAESRDLEGKWVIRNTRSSIEPFLTYSDRRDLREKAWRLFVERGDDGEKTDNNKIITEILNLRAERAKLLGHETHAHWQLQNTMARNPEAVMDLLNAVWKPAKARAHKEVADMQGLAKRMRMKIRIKPWDYRYFAEKVRKKRYDLDESQIKPYLQLDKLRDAMFWVADKLFDLEFTQVKDVPVFHPDVTVWLAKEKETNKPIGLFYFDPFARSGKRSGAWMSAYRRQERFAGNVLPIVSNNCNFLKPKKGEPALISWTDATTLFHEFGHALHGLLSNVDYPSLSGTAVFRDYVELPSQLLEHWLSTPELLERFALHHETGKPIPRKLVQRIERAATFNQGFSTVEFLGSAFVDMKIHLSTEKDIDPKTFERETLNAIGMPKEIVMRHRMPHFMHIFASDSYSAGYYSYLWADVLTADAFEAFLDGKGPYDREVADRLREHILSVGNTIDPAIGYRRFRGRDADVAALMRKRGFPVPKAKKGKKR